MSKIDQVMRLLERTQGFDREAVAEHVRLYDSATEAERRLIGRTFDAWFQRVKSEEDEDWLVATLNA